MPLPQAQCQSRVFSYSSLFSTHRTLDLHLWGPQMKKLRNSPRFVFRALEGRGSLNLPFCPQEQPYLLWLPHRHKGLCLAPGISGDSYD